MTKSVISMISSQRGICLGRSCGGSGSTAVDGPWLLLKRFPWFAIHYLQKPRSGRTGRSLTIQLTRCLCSSRYRLCVAARAAVSLQDLLAQAQRLRRDLDQLILCDELNGLLEVERLDRHQTDGFV